MVCSQERGGMDIYTHGNLALKQQLDNEFDLLFVAVYQNILQLSYVDKFLSDVQREFRERYRDELKEGLYYQIIAVSCQITFIGFLLLIIYRLECFHYFILKDRTHMLSHIACVVCISFILYDNVFVWQSHLAFSLSLLCTLTPSCRVETSRMTTTVFCVWLRRRHRW